MKHQKGFTPILIVLLIAALVGGYLSYQKQYQPTSLTPQPSPQISQKEQSMSSKTYTNTKYGFTLHSPNGLNIIRQTEENVLFSSGPNFNSIQIDFASEFKSPKEYKLCSELLPDEKPTPCIADGKSWGQNSDVDDIKLDGRAAKSFYLGGGVDYAYHLIQVDNPRLEIKIYVAGGGLDQQFKNILDTFKFPGPSDKEYFEFGGRRLLISRVGEGGYCEGFVGSQQIAYKKCKEGLKCRQAAGAIADAPGTCVKQ